MAGLTFRLNEVSGACSRILRIESSAREARPAEPPGQAALSGDARRRRILEEARSAVLDRIRHTR